MNIRSENRRGLSIAIVVVAFFTAAAPAQTTWYVDVSNACPGSGSVRDPFCTIQPAISAAANGDQILVAPGHYNAAINFAGKAIHLLGVQGPEETIIDATGFNRSVVTCTSGEGSNTILEGFTLTGGLATNGGGMRVVFGSPTVNNCIFVGNQATFGGAVSNEEGSNPTMTDCRFENNVATNTGGAVHNVFFSSATFNNCFFSGNSASSGGALWNSDGTFCNSHVTGSTFCENSPNDIFGAWHDSGGNEFLADCPVEACPGDINGDTVVNGFDLVDLLACWGPVSPGCEDADINGDTVVNGFDLVDLLAAWGPCP